MQGKLELLERLCRALQKERNDLNNRLGLLQKQGDKVISAPLEVKPLELLAKEEEEEEGGEEDQEGLPWGNRLEIEGIRQVPRPPELDPRSVATDQTTAAPATSSQCAETGNMQQD